MSKPATKAANSPFYLARMEAAKVNDRFSSREGAADETGIDRTRLARIELDSITPYPEEVMLLADAYDAPQLLNFYCSTCCPIGRQNVKPCALQEFDRVMMQALAALQGADKVSAAIISIARDGRVDPGEDVQMGEIPGLHEERCEHSGGNAALDQKEPERRGLQWQEVRKAPGSLPKWCAWTRQWKF